jgi:hypothetical protein
MRPNVKVEVAEGEQMEYVLLGLTLVMTAYFGNAILSRFPKGSAPNAFEYVINDFELDFRSTRVDEKRFSIGYATYWTIGNEFAIYGTINECGDGDKQVDLNGATTVKISIIPFGEWFDSVEIGRINWLRDERLEGVLHLPFQVARQLLDDLRIRTHRDIRLVGKSLKGDAKQAVLHSFYMC